MRRESKQENNFKLARISGYHCGSYDGKKVFTSDRTLPATRTYHLLDGTLPKQYGIELENQCWGTKNDSIYANIWKYTILPLFPDDLWKVERDGSLERSLYNERNEKIGCAAECITQTMTKAFIRNHYKDFRTMYNEIFPAFDISCDRTGDCGMHVHISATCFGSTKKTQDEGIRKLYYIINKHYRFMCFLLYRNFTRNGYCRQMDYTVAKTMDLENMSASHNNCFNGSDYENGNIELRLPGGQKDFACFRNTMESVFFLVDRVKTLSWKQCDDIATIFAGCNQYVFDRLKTYVKESGLITDEQLTSIKATVKREELI